MACRIRTVTADIESDSPSQDHFASIAEVSGGVFAVLLEAAKEIRTLRSFHKRIRQTPIDRVSDKTSASSWPFVVAGLNHRRRW